MIPARIYLDLDRTLFDTPKFLPELLAAAEELFGLDAVQFQKDIPKFYVNAATGGLRHYDFFGQIASHGINVQEADRALSEALRGRNYLYDDARELLGFLQTMPCEAHIISFGTQHYQQFKYRMAPELAALPCTVVFHPKDTFIREQPPVASWLVDDKLTHNLPDWCTMLHLDRTAPEPIVRQNGHTWRINSLKSVETAMSVGYNGLNQKGTL